MKRILFLVDAPLEKNIRAYKTISSLSKLFEITVIHRVKLEQNSLYYNIKNTNFFTIPNSIDGFFLRTFFLGNDFSKSFYKYCHDNNLNFLDFEIIYCVDLWTFPLAVSIKQLTKAKLIYDSYEICVETISQYYPQQNSFIRQIFFKSWIYITKKNAYYIERKAFKEVDLFVTTCKSYLNYFNDHYSIKNSIIVMNCPYKFDKIEPINLHKKFQIDISKTILLYIGNFNSGRKLELIIESAKHLNSNCHILFLGEGTLGDSLKKQSQNLPNVSVEGPFEMANTLNLMKGADFGILLLETSNLSKYYASANKVFDFLLLDKPMFLSNTPENLLISKESKKFIILNDDRPEAIAKIIDNYILEQHCKQTLNYHNVLSNDIYTWENQEVLLINAIQNVITQNNSCSLEST